MRHGMRSTLGVMAVGAALLVGLAAPAGAASAGAASTPVLVSNCGGQNAEVEQAVDHAFVYESWIGCGGIGFAYSADGGKHFSTPVTMPLSTTAKGGSWDPTLTVAPNGTLYVGYMIDDGTYAHPVLAASFDHGKSFPQVSSLIPPVQHNWGDRPFVAAGPHNTVYVTWDYGPSAAEVKFVCSPTGSCAFSNGDLNGVIQKSADGGKTWGPITPIGPGFPAQGADSVPLVVEPSGRIDALFLGHDITGSDLKVGPGQEYFTHSDDGGKTWAPRVEVGPNAGQIAITEWWIDGAIGIDQGQNLYATWDTQGPDGDVGWLSYSTDRGRTWSQPVRVTPDHNNAVHLLAVTGAQPGRAYLAWLTDASGSWALYARPFSIHKGWESDPVLASGNIQGSDPVWAGDTIGVSMQGSKLALSWGSAVGGPKSNDEIYFTSMTFHGH